jgi:serine/threonine protein phosphatase PrpC
MNDFSLSSKNDIIHNQQHILKRVKYLLKNMNACSDIGNERTKQEDSVLLLEHINNPNFRLLAVADGMGGLLLGGKASNLTLFEMIKWFERLPLSYIIMSLKYLLSWE